MNKDHRLNLKVLYAIFNKKQNPPFFSPRRMSVDRITIQQERTRKNPAKITFLYHDGSLKIEGPFRTCCPLFTMCVGDDETAKMKQGFSICRSVQSIGCVMSILSTSRERNKDAHPHPLIKHAQT